MFNINNFKSFCNLMQDDLKMSRGMPRSRYGMGKNNNDLANFSEPFWSQVHSCAIRRSLLQGAYHAIVEIAVQLHGVSIRPQKYQQHSGRPSAWRREEGSRPVLQLKPRHQLWSQPLETRMGQKCKMSPETAWLNPHQKNSVTEVVRCWEMVWRSYSGIRVPIFDLAFDGGATKLVVTDSCVENKQDL